VEKIENAALKFGWRSFDGLLVVGGWHVPQFFRTDC
jgi:hypothetical protein